MDKTFFDTNIYNHLDSTQIDKITAFKQNKLVEILTMPQILGELAATFGSDVERGKKVVRIYDAIISHRIIKLPPELILDEIKSLNDKKRRSVYIDSVQKRGFGRYIEDFKKGQLDEDTKKFVAHTKTKKRQHLEHCKNSKKQLDRLWDDEKVSHFPTFESFYEHAYRTGDIRREIGEYLNRVLDSSQRLLIPKISKIIEKRLYKLPHFETAIRINPALSYRYHLQKEKAKWGDMEDITNLISLPSCDIYVSDDQGARDMAKLLFPEKEALSLNEFLKRY